MGRRRSEGGDGRPDPAVDRSGTAWPGTDAPCGLSSGQRASAASGRAADTPALVYLSSRLEMMGRTAWWQQLVRSQYRQKNSAGRNCPAEEERRKMLSFSYLSLALSRVFCL